MNENTMQVILLPRGYGKATKEVREYIHLLEQENKRLKNELDNVKASYETEAEAKYYEYIDKHQSKLQEKINKALEYMKSEYTVTDDEVYLFLTNRVASLSKLENILKGEDNDNR